MKKKVRFKKEKHVPCHKDGSEVICSKPTELRAKIIAPVTLRQKMQNLWSEFREKESERNSFESISDAQDFDVNDDEFPSSPYEVDGELLDSMEAEQMYLNQQAEAIEKQSEAPAAAGEEKQGE
jgi:hypothetical protein